MMKRRQFIGAGLAVAGTGMLDMRAAFAQSKQIVVSNWGGDWNDRTVKFIEAPLLEQKGYRIVRDLNTAPQRRTKIVAEKNLPRGSLDVAHVSISDAVFLKNNDAIDTIDFKKIPNASDLVKEVTTPFFVPWLYSTWEIVYNPQQIKTPPTSLAELWNPAYAGRVGVTNQHYQDYIQMASLLASGKLHDLEAGKKKLLELKRTNKPKVYESHQQIAAGFKAGEIWIACNYRARALQFQADGIPVDVSFPKEGAALQTFGAVIPKKAANKADAYVYLNALLDPKGLSELCQVNFYSPASNKVTLPGAMGQKIVYTAEQRKKLFPPDFDWLSKNDAAQLEWWNKEFV
jgi:putative spermidine/putrescine transport system substrate-binding protein